jgi:hypothetical protein
VDEVAANDFLTPSQALTERKNTRKKVKGQRREGNVKPGIQNG